MSITNLSIDKIKQAIHEIDLKTRPKIIFMNPVDAEFVRTILPDIEKEIVIQSTSFVEAGKMYVMERADLFNLNGEIDNKRIYNHE